ncbi:hypothetical protein Lesp02_15560 [Lentzea sp. NBRC 105346]|uniref:hypothetical protein n=1 Tax=Lentzea sp. NBRC 105346 TaxID=3032205 RepID=UPI00249FCF38|nr:hypothetical protein [Lentzea sp. NBRC 105346]GLZ29366.1 hypothetical protein Lesp02_15560 [Lentzea sp. NBRC 105346]
MSRVHLSYSEPVSRIHPRGWTSPEDCLESRATAEELRDAINVLSGRDAARRRTWNFTPCTCSSSREAR